METLKWLSLIKLVEHSLSQEHHWGHSVYNYVHFLHTVYDSLAVIAITASHALFLEGAFTVIGRNHNCFLIIHTGERLQLDFFLCWLIFQMLLNSSSNFWLQFQTEPVVKEWYKKSSESRRSMMTGDDIVSDIVSGCWRPNEGLKCCKQEALFMFSLWFQMTFPNSICS